MYPVVAGVQLAGSAVGEDAGEVGRWAGLRGLWARRR